ncbi:histidine phosphatase family protein [Psychromicrobium xiongbiense]|uniref:histidine phosphatase family protein n=1 Tax=Psychromicrobium xiongbiense TaxID=3051184 RepID=UPI00255336AE|nr:histidine phosphatase family protein [Psychromicrobium sp. YIM S02556]
MALATVHLLRHGEVYNPEGVLYGRLPEYHLSDRGTAMAALAAEFFQRRRDGQDGAEGKLGVKRPFVYLAASPLVRAQETAAATAMALGLGLETDSRLIEAGNRFEGLRMSVRELLKPRNARWLYNPLRPSWGEPYAEQVLRMRAAIDHARAEAVSRGGSGAQAVLVSHQLPIWVSRLALEGRALAHDPRKRACSLASVTSVEFDDDRVLRVDYAEPAASLALGAATTPGA